MLEGYHSLSKHRVAPLDLFSFNARVAQRRRSQGIDRKTATRPSTSIPKRSSSWLQGCTLRSGRDFGTLSPAAPRLGERSPQPTTLHLLRTRFSFSLSANEIRVCRSPRYSRSGRCSSRPTAASPIAVSPRSNRLRHGKHRNTSTTSEVICVPRRRRSHNLPISESCERPLPLTEVLERLRCVSSTMVRRCCKPASETPLLFDKSR